MYESPDAINNSGCILISSSTLQIHTYPNLQREKDGRKGNSFAQGPKESHALEHNGMIHKGTDQKHNHKTKDKLYDNTKVQNSLNSL